MTPTQQQMFGGDWTQQKLEILRKYLEAYTTALKNTAFRLAYIDAFAGRGYLEPKREATDQSSLIPQDAERFLDGSASIALDIEHKFDEYVFVEKSAKKCEELQALQRTYSEHDTQIHIIRQDCNEYIPRLCEDWDWQRRRAVLFLDPFGMQVEWPTMKAVAATETIDLWVLFSIMGVNRLLQKRGEIPKSRKRRLDKTFGTEEWEDEFYGVEPEPLFETTRKTKTADFESIANFYLNRLQSIFPCVAENPRWLCKDNNPLFLLCFAMSNPSKRAQKLALRIANYILEN